MKTKITKKELERLVDLLYLFNRTDNNNYVANGDFYTVDSAIMQVINKVNEVIDNV